MYLVRNAKQKKRKTWPKKIANNNTIWHTWSACVCLCVFSRTQHSEPKDGTWKGEEDHVTLGIPYVTPPTLFFFISSPLVSLFSHEHLRWFRVSSCHVVRALSQGDRKGQTDKQIERKRKILYWLAHVTNSYHYHHHHTHSDSITQSRQKQPKPQRGGRPVILKPPYRCAIITTQYNNQKWEKKERIWLYTHSTTTSTYKEK